MEEVILYLRTSTKDQSPEIMKDKSKAFCEENKLSLRDEDILQEKKSAFKLDVIRDEWEKTYEKAIKEKKSIVLFRYDRSFRNQEKFVLFMRTMYEIHGLKVYSVCENWVNDIWEFTENLPNIPPPFDVLIKDIMKSLWKVIIEITGKQAEDESRKKGESVKNAVRRKPGQKTKSYKGNKWGKPGHSPQTKKRVIEKYLQGLSYSNISKSVNVYDKNKNSKPIPKSSICDIVKEYKSLSENT